ncbi:MAG TPA: hypothetical protein PK559_05550 [Ignavibacteriaceae bacterium]|nr:hypothetical protein [Ignavibacteriaceae bacterium]
MKLFLPKNIFTEKIVDSLEDNSKLEIKFLPASLVTKSVLLEDSLGLIPTLDIIKYEELFISSKFGLSFDDRLCNSYIYFKEGENELENIVLVGDLSSVETVLTKIVFSELYDTKVSVGLSEKPFDSILENKLLVGNQNFTDGHFYKGLSLSEEIIELISAPFVYYVFASKSEEIIGKSAKIFENLSPKFYEQFENQNLISGFPQNALEFVRENIYSVNVELEEQDREGINQLIRLPYYHGLIENIIEPKFL